MAAPCRQLAAYFAREGKREGGAARELPRLLRAFGVMVRNEDHPQHRPAAQIAILFPVFCLTAAMTAWVVSHPR